MCSKATSSPSMAHTRLYLMRPWSTSCSWLNRSVFSSVAGNRPTGMETRPKEMAPFHMALGIEHLRGRSNPRLGTLILLPPQSPPAARARPDSLPRYDGDMPRKRGPGPAFTVDFPRALPAEKKGEHWWMEADGQELRLSNLDKVFWPDEGYTKGDLVAYYFNIADRIIPYLAGRPLTMKRMPNGITGSFFYEKDAPSHTPDWMPRCAVESAGTGESRWGPTKHEVINYLMVENTAGLLFMANLGCIEFQPLHSRCGSIESPDYLFFDLDPFPPATFEDVLAVASLVRVVCDQLGLTSYPKISGATGMQVYVPIVP